MHPDQEAFLLAIDQDPDSEARRLIYADWLEENDQPEEATRQRKFLASKKWLTDLAARMGTHAERYGQGSREHYERTRNLDWRVPEQAAEMERLHDEYESLQGYRPVNYDDLVNAGLAYHSAWMNRTPGRFWWDGFVQYGSEELRNNVLGQTLEDYWAHWEVVTGLSKPNVTDDSGGMIIETPFGCSC